ncbi:hypothetical protein QN277_007261 [Acacia crassicarpa]|uniref:IBH1-like N-terminal domain-containing protein n=1 Tax=Acacia crassicarpa TaxID=499986 RepID=A0AAE1JR24_9FABA|nr:hypothetical protein QN277_007261 [Acacia crassicarpa]
MEGKLTKRRRIYSVEPRKIAQAEFARIYLSHLVPALMKLNQKKLKKKKSTVHSSEDDDEKKNSCVNVVKHEVGMAMVCSAPPGFAWSKALKAKFQTDYTDVGKINDDDGDRHHTNAPSSPYNFSANPTTGSSKSCLHNEEEEEEGFERLRRLMPGGEEMGEDCNTPISIPLIVFINT